MTEGATARPEWLQPRTREELGEEEAGHFGKWSRAGVPHKGWVCVDNDDVGKDNLEVCEMCETAEVRYVQVMTNPQWEGELRVGCVCAGRMMEDYAGAQRREAEFKKGQRLAGRATEQSERAARCLTWVRAADQILGAYLRSQWSLLDRHEQSFIRWVRERMTRAAQPKARKFHLSLDQQEWFKTIYQRVVAERRKAG
jgi:hypothetical protein